MSSLISYIPTTEETMYPKRYELPDNFPSYLSIEQAISQAPTIPVPQQDLRAYNMKQLFARGIASDLYHWLHPEKSNNELQFQYSNTHVSDIFRWGFHLRVGLEGEAVTWNKPALEVGLMDSQTFGLAYLVTISTFAQEEQRKGTITELHNRFQDTLYWKFVDMIPQTRNYIEENTRQCITQIPSHSIEKAIITAEKKTA